MPFRGFAPQRRPATARGMCPGYFGSNRTTINPDSLTSPGADRIGHALWEPLSGNTGLVQTLTRESLLPIADFCQKYLVLSGFDREIIRDFPFVAFPGI